MYLLVYDRTRYLILFESEKYHVIQNKIRYLISQKSGITYLISHNYGKIKIDWYDSLPLEQTLAVNVMTLIKIKIITTINYSLENAPINNMSMLHYDRIYVSEGIDINKTSTLKKCDICYYWYFLDKKFNFQPDVCNRCHDVLMMSVNLNNIAILNVRVFIIVASLTEQK